MWTGSRVSCSERLWALGGEGGQLGRAERERETKRERVISPHPASFLFKHESSSASRSSSPPATLFFCYPPLLFLAFLLPLPFHFFFLTLIFSLTYSIYYTRAEADEKSSRV